MTPPIDAPRAPGGFARIQPFDGGGMTPHATGTSRLNEAPAARNDLRAAVTRHLEISSRRIAVARRLLRAPFDRYAIEGIHDHRSSDVGINPTEGSH